jgi:hypothetical protein
LAAALAACGPARIRVSYPAGDSPEELAAAKALSQVYVVFDEEDGTEDLGAFAARLDAALKARGGAVLAYRAAPPGPDPFLGRLAPSSVLRLSLDLGPLQRSDFEKEVKSKDKDGKESVRKEPFTRLHRRLEVTAVLSAPGSTEEGFRRALWVEEGEEKGRAEAKAVGEAAWMKRHSEKLLQAAAGRVALALPAPRALTRERVLFVDKEDAGSKEASYKAQEGGWEEASALWAARLEDGKGGWRELWNLAVAAEQSKAYAEAERLFRKAGEAASSDASAAAPFPEAAADAARGARLFARSEAAAAYFARPTAVLPFSDDTTSVDGPANLRRMAAQTLARGGYATLDVEEVDRALRRRGYSQGGQLKRGKPADFAAWTGAERLVFGDVTEFRNMMLGFLGRREVAGRLWLWDAESESEVYSCEKSAVSQEGTLDGADAAGRLAGQLGKALLEGWTGKPLGAESALWVVRSLQGLPLRPPAKR